MLQHRFHRRQRERMADERAGKEGHADFGIGVVAVLPHAAIESVHEASFARKNADRHAAGDDLSVGRKIGANAKQRLASALVNAKSGNDFVEDQRGVGCFGDVANLLQKFDRLQVRMAALHRFDQHRGKIACILPNPFERFFGVP